MDWKIALKVGGPSVIAAWLFHSLISSFLETSEIFKSNLLLNILLLAAILVFCLFMGYILVRNKPPAPSEPHKKNEVTDNEVTDNEVGKNLKLGETASVITKNKIKRNKIDGDLDIG
ncbi:MAG: hypothetical protein GYB20_02605 [Oceanospirillales bacterium]|nr:hypothetical protein [Oceanospirillales bacterium]MBR9886582.1 hypothetical protein [Oceanospirillales bacterium]